MLSFLFDYIKSRRLVQGPSVESCLLIVSQPIRKPITKSKDQIHGCKPTICPSGLSMSLEGSERRRYKHFLVTFANIVDSVYVSLNVYKSSVNRNRDSRCSPDGSCRSSSVNYLNDASTDKGHAEGTSGPQIRRTNCRVYSFLTQRTHCMTE